METHWLLGRENRVPLSKTNSKSFNWTAPMSAVTDAVKPTPSGGPVLNKQASVATEESSKLVKGIVKKI